MNSEQLKTLCLFAYCLFAYCLFALLPFLPNVQVSDTTIDAMKFNSR